MAKTTLRQIEERLRGMFTPGEQRKLVFWYDESASFENEVNQLDLPGVTVYRMEPRTQFATKWMLEIDHPDESFLIYAPFAKPPTGGKPSCGYAVLLAGILHRQGDHDRTGL